MVLRSFHLYVALFLLFTSTSTSVSESVCVSAHLGEVHVPGHGALLQDRSHHQPIAPQELVVNVPGDEVVRKDVKQRPDDCGSMHVGLREGRRGLVGGRREER